MVDVEAMKNDFIEQRKRHNEELRLNQSGKMTNYISYKDGIKEVIDCKPFRLKEKPLNENPHLLLIAYKNGMGGMVIDQEQFDKFPKRKQDKIYKLANSIQEC